MAIQVTAINGMGSYLISGSTITAQGMRDIDHMHISEDFLSGAGVADLTTDLRVTENSLAGASVLVSVGTAYILNRNYTRNQNTQTRFWRVINDGSVVVNIAANASGNPRIDSIFIRVDPSVSAGANGELSASIGVLQGTPAASPSAPSIPADGRSYYILANVAVANGFATIVNANITNQRVQTALRANDASWILVPFNLNWTRTGAQTMTVPANLTAFIGKGTRIRLTDTTTKYFNVQSAVWSGSITTVTFITSTDYSLISTPSNVSYSNATPSDFPLVFNYTPSYSCSGSMTISAVSTTLAQFYVLGSHVFVSIKATFTLGGSAASEVQVTLPANHQSGYESFAGAFTVNGATLLLTSCQIINNQMRFFGNANLGNWSTGSAREVRGSCFYPIA